MSTRQHTCVERVITGERIRRPSWERPRTVASHGPGILRGIRLDFTDGSSLTAMPSTPVEVSKS